MNKYRVYIEQVNQTYIDVEARTEESARTKACLDWMDRTPVVMSVEKLTDQDDTLNP